MQGKHKYLFGCTSSPGWCERLSREAIGLKHLLSSFPLSHSPASQPQATVVPWRPLSRKNALLCLLVVQILLRLSQVALLTQKLSEMGGVKETPSLDFRAMVQGFDRSPVKTPTAEYGCNALRLISFLNPHCYCK